MEMFTFCSNYSQLADLALAISTRHLLPMPYLNTNLHKYSNIYHTTPIYIFLLHCSIILYICVCSLCLIVTAYMCIIHLLVLLYDLTTRLNKYYYYYYYYYNPKMLFRPHSIAMSKGFYFTAVVFFFLSFFFQLFNALSLRSLKGSQPNCKHIHL